MSKHKTHADPVPHEDATVPDAELDAIVSQVEATKTLCGEAATPETCQKGVGTLCDVVLALIAKYRGGTH